MFSNYNAALHLSHKMRIAVPTSFTKVIFSWILETSVHDDFVFCQNQYFSDCSNYLFKRWKIRSFSANLLHISTLALKFTNVRPSTFLSNCLNSTPIFSTIINKHILYGYEYYRYFNYWRDTIFENIASSTSWNCKTKCCIIYGLCWVQWYLFCDQNIALLLWLLYLL